MKNDDSVVPTLGWSDFARRRHVPGGRHTWFEGSEDELLDRVRAGWARRRPGAGRDDLTQVVLVPVSPDGFVSSTVLVDETTPLTAVFDRRQEHEDGFIRVLADGPREEVRYASVVLYSADTLLENDGARSGDDDWEVVCLVAGPVVDEPMDPLTMARNMLSKPGGTSCAYTAEQFAESVWYWSRRASAAVFLLPLLLALACAGPAGAAILDVASDGSGAYADLQQALQAAQPGDTLRLGDGTFTGAGNRNLVLGGAVTLRSATGDPATCILDLQQQGRAFLIYSAAGTSVFVEGITIRDGDCRGLDEPAVPGYGGAVYAEGLAPGHVRG